MISKALNGKDGISDELRRTIINTAQEMGYERLPTDTVNRFAFIVSKHFFLETDAFYSEMYYRFSYSFVILTFEGTSMQAFKELTPVQYDDSGVCVLTDFIFQPLETCLTVHWHDKMELLLLRDGSLDFHLNEQLVGTAHAGEVAIAAPRQPHAAIACSEGVAYDAVMFEADTFLNAAPVTAQFLRPLLEGRIELRPVSSSLWNAADAVIHLSEQQPMQAIGYVYQLLPVMMESCVVSIHPSGAADQRFREVVEYVNVHYTEPLTTALLSEHFGYDEAYFCRRFKKATGLTVLRYIEVLRLEMAQRLLLETDTEISRIAAQCGFGDVCYFSHRFHRHTGTSPSAFRRGDAARVSYT